MIAFIFLVFIHFLQECREGRSAFVFSLTGIHNNFPVWVGRAQTQPSVAALCLSCSFVLLLRRLGELLQNQPFIGLISTCWYYLCEVVKNLP